MDPHDYLNYYSRFFNSVEIDSTFYGTPPVSTVKRWASQTPESFKFSLKVPRQITHELRLIDARGYFVEFVDRIQELGARLGVILFQFPPSFKADQMVAMAEFFTRLPPELRFAVEVRDSSWYSAADPFASMLRNVKVAWAAVQYPGLPEKIHLTGTHRYIRWIGQHGSYTSHSQERIDRTPDLLRWNEAIQASSLPGEPLFGYFNNDYAGFAVGTLLKFRNLIGWPVEIPQQPKQARLF
ncbi:MAG: DUF72 domain-containing protein [Anaerolineales bacterium]|nr:DUF72 domain-containing protein [Anaerolineales bacterium]